jgi:hypothetical protein
MKYTIAITCILLLCLAGTVGASNYKIEWKCINSGGVLQQSSANYGAKITLAQPVAGNCQGSSYKAHLGFWYCVKSYLGVGILEPPVAGDAIPKAFRLEQNYPNPFNPSTTIEYAVPQPGWVTVSVYNVMGERIVTLIDRFHAVGYYRTTWDGIDDRDRTAPSGIYFYRLETNGTMTTKKMILLK